MPSKRIRSLVIFSGLVLAFVAWNFYEINVQAYAKVTSSISNNFVNVAKLFTDDRNNDEITIRDELGNDVLWSWGGDYRKSDVNDKRPIRKWGCNRMEVPLIFVHIGKCGGGSVRARIAAGAVNYTDTAVAWQNSHSMGAYYPVAVAVEGNGTDEEVMEKAYFCNSVHGNYRSSDKEETFEGTMKCNASTPLGHMIGCPEVLKKANICLPGACDATSPSCRIVYVGHNLLGRCVCVCVMGMYFYKVFNGYMMYDVWSMR